MRRRLRRRRRPHPATSDAGSCGPWPTWRPEARRGSLRGSRCRRGAPAAAARALRYAVRMRATAPALRACVAARPTSRAPCRSLRLRMAAAAASAPEPEPAKTIHLIRHGVTEMNVYLSVNNWARRVSSEQRISVCRCSGARLPASSAARCASRGCGALTRRVVWRAVHRSRTRCCTTRSSRERARSRRAPRMPLQRRSATRLTAHTPSSTSQASSLAKRVASLSPAPQLLVASPLRRALRTAELAFADAPPLPRLVSPLCRERLYHSSDVGRAPAIIAAEHPSWGGFDALDPIWWHSNGDGDPLSHDPEPEGARLHRGRAFGSADTACGRFRSLCALRRSVFGAREPLPRLAGGAAGERHRGGVALGRHRRPHANRICKLRGELDRARLHR